MDNRHALSALDSLFSDPVYVWSIDSIYIHAYSSPEGKSDYNLELSRRRSQAMSKYLTERYPMLKLGSRISCISGGENWDGMREAVARASDFNEREEVLMIIDQVSDLARREQLLKRLNAGLAYRYIKDNILPSLRNAVVCVIRTRRPLPDKRHPSLPPVRSFPPAFGHCAAAVAGGSGDRFPTGRKAGAPRTLCRLQNQSCRLGRHHRKPCL